MITTINPDKGCCGKDNSNVAQPYPHTHDDRYYTKSQIDIKIEGINKVLIGSGVPAEDLGKVGDLFIDKENQRRPIYMKLEGDIWSFVTNLNELDTEILEATQEV